MKRDPWLTSFSHDHQHGLAQALRLRRAVESDDRSQIARCVQEALAFAEGDLAVHMAAEESELLPLLNQLECLDPADAERVAADHLGLRTLLNHLRAQPRDPEVARRFAEALHDHIRWEERHLFQRWQKQLTSSQTDVIARALANRRTAEA